MTEFEWDEDKAEENVAKHGVTFDFAVYAFEDPNATERIDNRENYGEIRYVLCGMAFGVLLTVVHTERGDCTRLISAWRASKRETNDYYSQKAW